MTTNSPLTYPPAGAYLFANADDNPPIPEDSPTAGFRLNHTMLRIRDPRASLHFYIDIMGMRSIFTQNMGPFTVYFLGYPESSVHRADPTKFSFEMGTGGMPHTSGLLELVHHHGWESKEELSLSTGNQPPHLGFGHLGFTVPDVPAVEERLRKEGVKVVKPLGTGVTPEIGVSDWEKERGIGTESVQDGFQFVLKQISFVEDPDGYSIELVPQKLTPPPKDH